MGTSWSVVLYSPSSHTDLLQARIEDELQRLTAQMSTWEPDSALSRFNRSADTWQQLPDDTFQAVAHALALAQESGGAYDPSVGPTREPARDSP